MAAGHRGWFVALVVAACGGGGDGQPDGGAGFDQVALLASVANGVVVPTLASFSDEATKLANAVATQCGTAAAQAAWRSAATVWQRAELMRVGPTRMELRDRIYSWPVVAACPVDQEVMAYRSNPSGYDIATKLVNRRGLPALEYLLFSTSLASACASAPAGWAALSDAEKGAARCAYATVVAEDLRVQAVALHAAWTGGYATTLATAGSPFRNPHEAVNVVSDALFALDTDVKTAKLGRPAGTEMGTCPTLGSPCPQDVEAPWSNHSKENIAANLRGFRLLFTGGDGVGFDDYLTASGASALAAKMTTDIDAAIAAVEAIPGTLATAVVDAPATVKAAHDAVRLVTNELKSQFLTVLALDIPDDVGDDTD